MNELNPGRVKEGMAEAGAKSADLWMVPIGEIHTIKGFNVRTANADLEEHITWLQGQITDHGFDKHKPLAGYVALEGGQNKIYVYDGHCRLEATKRAVKKGLEIEVLPVVISPKGTNMGDLVATMATAATSKPLEPIEKGMVCKKLIALNWTEDKIAGRLGITKAYVNSLLDLAAAPAPIRKMVEQGNISATTAMKVMKQEGENAEKTLTTAVSKAAKGGRNKATAKDLAPAQAAAGGLATSILKFEENFPMKSRPVVTVVEAEAWVEILRLARG